MSEAERQVGSSVGNVLTDEEVMALMDDVLSPSVDNLIGGTESFTCAASIGSEWRISRKFAKDGLVFRVGIEAGIYQDEEGARQVGLTFWREDMESSLTEQLVAIANDDILHDTLEVTGIGDDQATNQAWKVCRYEFSSEEANPYHRDEWYELQDNDGECLWSDADPDDPIQEVSHVGEDLFNQLAIEVGIDCTKADIGSVDDILKLFA